MKSKRLHLIPQKKSFDWLLLALVILLVLFGLVMVYDASLVQSLRVFKETTFYIRHQLMWAFLGFLSLIFFANFNYHNLKKLAGVLLGISFILLLAVFVPGLGSQAGGAHRWLDLKIITLQPAELFKLCSVIWLSATFEKQIRLRSFFIFLFISSAILGFLQRDLGSAVVFVGICASIYIVSGGSWIKLLLTAPAMVIGLIWLVASSPYRQKRILGFLDPFSDPQGYTYHISQVLIALGSGGLFGLGLGQSRQKFYIPEVTSDSIFAIVGEELGLFGTIFLIALFTALIIKGFNVAQGAKDQFGKILAAGLTSWLGIQAIVNLGTMVSLFPLTGVPLPFISYGGSALVANMTAVGILLNIRKQSV